MRRVATGFTIAWIALALDPALGAFGLHFDIALEAAESVAGRTRLTPVGGRITDEAIERDKATLAHWQSRLDALDERNPSPSLYQRAKARAWLSFATDEYWLNDRGGAVEAAFDQAVLLIAGLEGDGRDLPLETPALFGADELGRRHWQLAFQARLDPGFHCVEAEVAMLEIELVRAGHETVEDDPCRAEEHLAAADRLADEVRRGLVKCQPEPEARPIAEAPPEPKLDLAAIQRRIEQLPKLVHFALDKSTISPVTATVLDTVAQALVDMPLVRVELEGHADKRASYEYNLRLSKRRAQAVHDHLVSRGVEPERIELYFAGESKPRVGGETIVDFAKNRYVSFRYIPPEGVEILEVPQEGDLQLEKPVSGGRSR